jgi:hypothetical protein
MAHPIKKGSHNGNLFYFTLKLIKDLFPPPSVGKNRHDYPYTLTNLIEKKSQNSISSVSNSLIIK